MSRAASSRAMRWALAAALVGALPAVVGTLSDEPSDEAPNGSSQGEVVARVGEVSLLRAEVDGELRRVGLDPSSAAAADRDGALERLIEQELWWQGATDQSLLKETRGLRDAVVRRMFDNIFPSFEEPDARALETLYREAYGDVESPPALEDVSFRLEKTWRRQRNEQALQTYLAWLRQDTRVVVTVEEQQLTDLLKRLEAGEGSGS